jgi:hypothetical protein
MAQKFLTNIDLNTNQLINATFEVLAADPTTNLFEGRMYYNSTYDIIRYYTGTSWKLLVNNVTSGGTYASALTINESGGSITITANLATTEAAGLLSSTFYNDLNDATANATANKLVKRDANGNISVATPTSDGHAATKGYVDAARSGLDVKQSVRVATTDPINIATDLEAGDTIDGVTLAAGDRVLVKNQSTASENGIYVAVVSGAAGRSADADESAEVTAGMFTFVAEGNTNADSGWVLTTNDTITLGTTGLAFAQFSGAGQITAGNGLTKTGNTIDAVGTADRIVVNPDSIDIASTYVGQTSITTLGTIGTGTWEATDVGIAHGGTNASDATTARTNLGIKTSAGAVTTSTPTLARIAAQGNTAHSAGTSTTTVTHNFNTTDVIVQVYEVATGETVIGDVTRPNPDTVQVVLLGSHSANAFRIVVTAV